MGNSFRNRATSSYTYDIILEKNHFPVLCVRDHLLTKVLPSRTVISLSSIHILLLHYLLLITTLTQLGTLRRHQATHMDVRPFHCTTCGKQFKRKEDLNRHVRIDECKPESRKCPHCEEIFQSRYFLKTHLTTVHGLIEEFECEVCHKKFILKTNLAAHMKYHIGNKNFSCNICSKAFYSNSKLFLEFWDIS